MKVFTFKPQNFSSNSYLLYSNNIGVVIDPSIPYKECVAQNKSLENINVKFLILTHAHFDHFLCIDEWIEKTNAQVMIGYRDADALSDPFLNCYKLFLNSDNSYNGEFITLRDGDTISLDDESIKILETPGHTTGSISILTDGLLFVGDLIFSGGGVGRTDLPGGNYSELLSSIKRVINLPNDITIYPGHNNPTSTNEIKNLYKG